MSDVTFLHDEEQAAAILLEMRRKAFAQAKRNLTNGVHAVNAISHYVDASAKYIAALEADRARRHR